MGPFVLSDRNRNLSLKDERQLCAESAICKVANREGPISRYRPKADIQLLIAMLRSQPALPPFGTNATSEIGRSTTLD